MGRWPCRNHFVQFPSADPMSTTLPTTLGEAEYAWYLFPFDAHPVTEEDWVEKVADKLVQTPNALRRIPTMRVAVHASIGQTFTAPLERGMRERLEQACMRKIQQAEEEAEARSDG